MKKIFLTQLALSTLLIATSCEDGNKSRADYSNRDSGTTTTVDENKTNPPAPPNHKHTPHNNNGGGGGGGQKNPPSNNIIKSAPPQSLEPVPQPGEIKDQNINPAQPTPDQNMGNQPKGGIVNTGENNNNPPPEQPKPEGNTPKKPEAEKKPMSDEDKVIKAIRASEKIIVSKLGIEGTRSEKELAMREAYKDTIVNQLAVSDGCHVDALITKTYPVISEKLASMDPSSRNKIDIKNPIIDDTAKLLHKQYEGCLTEEEFKSWLQKTIQKYSNMMGKKEVKIEDIKAATDEVVTEVFEDNRFVKKTEQDKESTDGNTEGTVKVTNTDSGKEYTIGQMRKAGSSNDGATESSGAIAAKAIIPGLAIVALGTIAAIAVVDP